MWKVSGAEMNETIQMKKKYPLSFLVLVFMCMISEIERYHFREY